MRLVAASETSEKGKSDDEMFVSVEVSLGLLVTNREFMSGAGGQHRGTCSRVASIPSPSASRAMSVPRVGGGGWKLT